MNNIFENAYFGKPYKTRDGRKVLYHSYNNIYPDNPYQNHHNLILEEKDGIRDTVWIWCNDYGHVEEHVEGEWLNETNSDIISEWREEIDEEKLAHLSSIAVDEHVPECGDGQWTKHDLDAMYRKGYRKAKEA